MPGLYLSYKILFTQFGKVLMKIRDCFDTLIEVSQTVLFIGRMQVIAIQTKAHQDGFKSEFFLKQRYDRNTSTSTHRDGRFTKGSIDGFAGSFESYVVDRCNIRTATMMGGYLYFY